VKLPVPLRLLKDRYLGEASRSAIVAKNRLSDLSERLTPEVAAIAGPAVTSLISYQDPDYALLYLDRLTRYVGGDPPRFLPELAQQLDRRMRFEDPPALAQRALDGGGSGGIVSGHFCFTDVIGLLPPSGANPVLPVMNYLGWAGRGVTFRFNGTTTRGRKWAQIWALQKHIRIYSKRSKIESAWVERWLHMIDRVTMKQPDAATEVVRSADMIQGSGRAYHLGLANWHAVVDRLIKPVCDGTLDVADLAQAVRTVVNQAKEDSGRPEIENVISQVVADAAGR
jgi:hypothetical protein